MGNKSQSCRRLSDLPSICLRNRAVDENSRLSIKTTVSYPIEKQKTTAIGMLEHSVAVHVHDRLQAIMGGRMKISVL